MQLYINGETRRVDQASSVADLIVMLSLTGRRIAVEVNESIVPRTRHATTTLNEGDRVEIVHAIGGG
ncbi:sulfur carrier protein ThiS [Kushneria marisflavi]|uniref:Thiamine biosynthesis protein ThiS n=1 Tax=Kushneria marisflavi TaxID=157779 RepID=A0A240UPH3_9GAMM|nr:sulfur carrier protein ThiS [Kushneria marisflavi]ART62942.1 thiamine biosynthesis protein ThiS [Kushneria marisflavi]RKD84833.1 sulfur carrier protein ThiS [Kushneria marisflavi]